MRHAIAILALCSSTAFARPLAEEVTLTGNHVFDVATLRHAMTAFTCDTQHQLDTAFARMHPGPNGIPILDDAAPCGGLDDLVGTISTFYFAHGYIDATVESSADPNGHPIIEITENARYAFGTVAIRELDGPADALGDQAQLGALVSALHPGQPFLREPVRAAVRAAVQRFQAAGYGLVLAVPHLDIHRDTHVINLRVDIERNHLITIGPIDVVGAPAAALPALHELLALHTGDIYRETLVDEARARLVRRFPKLVIVEDVHGTAEEGREVSLTVTVN
jgi:outer membrane protein assembly factor BamA